MARSTKRINAAVRLSSALLCVGAALFPLAMAAAQTSKPPVLLGRVKPTGERSICQMAADAKARNSPAAPGLARQCAAAAQAVQPGVPAPPSVGFGRVKPPPVQLGRVESNGSTPERSICQAATDADARNSPAAPGLARQCAATQDELSANSAAPLTTDGTPGDVRLSRIYTGGGSNEAGPTVSDFVELRNRGQVALALDGWSLQYASPQGTNWQVIPLSGTIMPDRIYLIAAGSLRPDQVSPLQLGMTSGKLALVRSVRSLEGSCPIDGGTLVDFIGYGTANCALGRAMATGTALSAFGRRQDGCSDTRENSADFSAVAPDELDRASPVDTCAVE